MAASATAQRDVQRVTQAYYLRQGLYQTAADKCTEWLARRGEPLLVYWKSVAQGLTGNIPEAIRGLQGLQMRRETEFPAMVALFHFHRLASIVDRESVETLDASLPAAQSSATDSALVLAANFKLYTGGHEEAATLVDRLTVGDPQIPLQHQAQVVLAWSVLLRQPATRVEEETRSALITQLQRVNEALELDVLLARSMYYDLYGQPQQALECLNQAVAMQPSFAPALIEKSRVLMAQGDWELGHEVVMRVLSQEPDNVEALRLLTLHSVTREASSRAHVNMLKQLEAAIDKCESRNDRLMYAVSRLFCRMVGRRNREAIRFTLQMVEKAANLLPNQVKYITEIGHQMLMLGDTVSAMDAFRQASKVDQMSMEALYGMVECQVANGQLEDAEQQMEFLAVIHESQEPNSRAVLLQAMLAWRRAKDGAQHVALLDRVVDLSYAKYREVFKGRSSAMFLRYEVLDPDFLFEVAQEYLTHTSLIPASGSATSSSTIEQSTLVPVQKGLQVLEKLVGLLPGLLIAQVEMARAHMAIGDLEGAQALLEEALRREPTSSECQLLMARVALAQENHKLASYSLEQALSNDFSVRSSPVYHLLRAQILSNQGSLEDALKALEEARKLDGSDVLHVSMSDRMSVHLETMAILSRLGRLQEAQAALQEAKMISHGTPEEVRVILASAELAIKRNDLDGALKVLDNVARTSPAFTQAQVFKANVYLTHRHDRRAYAQCYLDLVSGSPSAVNYVLLGEAYMRIQAPESAIEAYQAALDMKPSDHDLAIKIGRALVSTHDYRKAMDYYESALVQSPSNAALRQDLARLYSKLGKHTTAANILQHSVEQTGSFTDISSLFAVVQSMMLLAEVVDAGGEGPDVLDTLVRAWNLQRSVVERCRRERPDLLPEQTRVAAEVCFRMGQHHKDNDDRAVECFKDAVRIDETFEPALLALAQMYKRMGRLEECQKYCQTLVRINAKEAERASMLLGELAFLKGDYDQATLHYRQLLEKNPNNYPALVKLLGLLRSAGKLDEAKEFITRAETADPRSSAHMGLAYCKGLYYRYVHDVYEAVKYFNLARKDGEWAVRALGALVELYTDPNKDLLSEEDIAACEDASVPAAKADAAAAENLKVAEKLLLELGKIQTDTRRQAVLQNYYYLATKTKANIDKASSGFIELIETDKEYLPALLGVSISFILKHQPDKARNTLRMIAKMPYDSDLTDEFERSYLVLAELYAIKAKYDLAQDLCRKCLGYNKSCGEAWDLMGRIMEKEQAYRDAAACYEKAWQLEHQSSAAVGFKLAYNYLKAKRFVDAVNVCNQVLAAQPDYPRIRFEILDKAIHGLRPAVSQ